MALVSEIGNIVFGEVHIEWKIRDFFSLPDKALDYYTSPVFSFADTRWFLKLFPNDQVEDSSSKWLGLFLVRKDTGPIKTVYYTLGIKGPGKRKLLKRDFSKKNEDWGFHRFWLRSDLSERKSTLVPDNVLTVTCNLRKNAPNAAKVPMCNRACKVSLNMKSILAEGKRSDFILKTGDRKWPVHKLILESRSEYFANMFRHEWVENIKGEVTFDDIEEVVLDSVINFIYTGNVEGMSAENVFDIYEAAHKFLLDDLRALCVEWMKENICLEILCRILDTCNTYEERDLKECAIEYFIEEADHIFDSQEWKKLDENNRSIAAELLKETTKRLRKKRLKQ